VMSLHARGKVNAYETFGCVPHSVFGWQIDVYDLARQSSPWVQWVTSMDPEKQQHASGGRRASQGAV
jgi:hypothetical protein